MIRSLLIREDNQLLVKIHPRGFKDFILCVLVVVDYASVSASALLFGLILTL